MNKNKFIIHVFVYAYFFLSLTVIFVHLSSMEDLVAVRGRKYKDFAFWSISFAVVFWAYFSFVFLERFRSRSSLSEKNNSNTKGLGAKFFYCLVMLTPLPLLMIVFCIDSWVVTSDSDLDKRYEDLKSRFEESKRINELNRVRLILP